MCAMFLNNIYIVGLTLGFNEYHLWWLITYRNRMKIKEGLPFRNIIKGRKKLFVSRQCCWNNKGKADVPVDAH